MFLQSLLPRAEIGANSYLLDLAGTRIVLDAGMHPKAVGLDSLPDFGPLGFDKLDAIVVSHAHHDHIGALPVLQRQCPSADVFMTEATAALSEAMLHNSVNVMSSQREELGIKEFPLFTHRELDEVCRQWRTHAPGRPFDIGKAGATAEFFDAGHILGSVGVLIRSHDRTIFYTGDVNFDDQTIARGALFPKEKIDTLIIESTRGDSPRRPDYTRAGEAQRLARHIRETVRRGGSVLMPVFALGKSQELLIMLHELRLAGEIPALPVFIGGLSVKVTKVYDDFAFRGRRAHVGFEILKAMPELKFSARPRGKKVQRQPMAWQPGAIYALSSGMMTEHTVSNEFAFQFLQNPANSLLFVGYADPDSPAGRIRSSKPGDRITLDDHRPPVVLRCQVESFDFSGHSDRESLRRYVNEVRPRQIILVHGEPSAMEWFKTAYKTDLPDTSITVAPGGGLPVVLA